MPKRIVVFCVLLFVMTGPALAGNPIRMGVYGQAEVTQLTGAATLERKGLPQSVALEAGQTLAAGDFVKTGPGCRLEIVMADKSVVRFDENSSFELTALNTDPAQERNVNVRMYLGKVWSRVAKRLTRKGRFSVSSRTCIAGVRGTVYRMNVASDDTSVVKVYTGEVQVDGSKGVSGPSGATAPKALGKPTSVSGPTPVAGPKPVTMEEWTYIVKSMQQIVVRPDGSATKPFSFDPRKDMIDCVRWDHSRDYQ